MACERYQNLSEEDKHKKRQYAKTKNMVQDLAMQDFFLDKFLKLFLKISVLVYKNILEVPVLR